MQKKVILRILLSIHNNERFVRDAILSILTQTYRDFELLIVNDASTDSTPEILQELAQNDVRIRILTNSTNLGLTKSLSSALKKTRGELIARMDADDIALPHRLEKQLAFLNAHPDIDMVGTAYEWIDEHGNVIGTPNVVTDPTTLQRRLIRTNPFLHSSILIRRSILERVGGYDTTYKKAQDYDLWLRLSQTCKFSNLPEILMRKRVSKTMISVSTEREQLKNATRARYHAIRRGDYPLWCAVYLFKPWLASVLPRRLVRLIRIHLFKQIIYRDL